MPIHLNEKRREDEYLMDGSRGVIARTSSSEDTFFSFRFYLINIHLPRVGVYGNNQGIDIADIDINKADKLGTGIATKNPTISTTIAKEIGKPGISIVAKNPNIGIAGIEKVNKPYTSTTTVNPDRDIVDIEEADKPNIY